MPEVYRAMDSANAMDCLMHLSRTKLSEREALVQLNDKFVDIIESVHYMEAEHGALEHDYNLLKTGIQSDSVGLNELFEFEIRNVRSNVDEVNRGRQALLHEQNNLAQQVKEMEQQWRHYAKAALGVPKDVDDDFIRISNIEAENSLTLRRIKYVEDKNRLIKQNNGRIYEQINLMRMRKDQAVSLHHEYLNRKNELLNSIRNLEEDNKAIIMNEHKYFVRDRTVDRHTFRDQLRQAIADIRADYEVRRLRNEEEIRIRMDTEIGRINANTNVNIVRDRLREELLIVKNNYTALQQQVSDCEVRNAALIQQIEIARLEISENHQTFEASIDFKNKEIEKLREQCTSISLELEKLCDLNIDLQKEIARYRELLDQSAYSSNRPTGNYSSATRTTNSSISHSHSRQYDTIASRPVVPTTLPAPPPVIIPAPAPYTPPANPVPTFIQAPIPAPVTAPVIVPAPRSVSEHSSTFLETGYTSRDRSPVRPVVSSPARSNTFETSHTRTVYEPYRPSIPASTNFETVSHHDLTTHTAPARHQYTDSESTRDTVTEFHHSSPATERTQHPRSARDDEFSSHSRVETNNYMHRPEPITFPATNSHQSTVVSHRTIYDTHQQQQSRDEGRLEYSSDVDSVDEENFQRFTRWYKGRVKISDVTPEYVQLVNRSSKKSQDIGNYKLIHEFGHNSIYVDLPTGLILGPKESLKVTMSTGKSLLSKLLRKLGYARFVLESEVVTEEMLDEIQDNSIHRNQICDKGHGNGGMGVGDGQQLGMKTATGN